MLNFESLQSGDFYFNGKWLSDLGGIIAGQSGLSPLSVLPQLEIKTEKILGRDGEMPYDASYNPRTFTIPVLFNDMTRVREISQWLNTKVPAMFYIKNDTVAINCMIDTVIDVSLYTYQGIVELKFIAHNPYYYAINDKKYIINKTDTVSTTTNGNIITMNVLDINNITISNDGNVDSFPIYKLVGVGTLSLRINDDLITISNVTDYVLLDVLYGKAYRDGAVPVNFLGSMDGSFVNLKSGNNVITATGCTSVEVQCRSRWI